MSSIPLIFVWLDQRIGNLPGGNEKLKEKFRKILSPIKQFDKPTICTDFIQDSIKDKRILFITSGVFAEKDFLEKISSLSNVIYIYIYDQLNKDYQINNKNLQEKMGEQRIIHFDERLYEQLIQDLVHLYQIQGDKFIQDKQNKEAKLFYELSKQLIDTIDDKDQDIQQIQQDLITKIQQIN